MLLREIKAKGGGRCWISGLQEGEGEARHREECRVGCEAARQGRGAAGVCCGGVPRGGAAGGCRGGPGHRADAAFSPPLQGTFSLIIEAWHAPANYLPEGDYSRAPPAGGAGVAGAPLAAASPPPPTPPPSRNG